MFAYNDLVSAYLRVSAAAAVAQGRAYVGHWFAGNVANGTSVNFEVLTDVHPTGSFGIGIEVAGDTAPDFTVQVFKGGTVTPGTAVILNPLNEMTTLPNPIARITRDATITVPGTEVMNDASSRERALVGIMTYIMAPSSQYYLVLTNNETLARDVHFRVAFAHFDYR